MAIDWKMLTRRVREIIETVEDNEAQFEREAKLRGTDVRGIMTASIIERVMMEVAPVEEALREVAEFLNNGTPVHPGSLVAANVRAALRKAKEG